MLKRIRSASRRAAGGSPLARDALQIDRDVRKRQACMLETLRKVDESAGAAVSPPGPGRAGKRRRIDLGSPAETGPAPDGKEAASRPVYETEADFVPAGPPVFDVLVAPGSASALDEAHSLLLYLLSTLHFRRHRGPAYATPPIDDLYRARAELLNARAPHPCRARVCERCRRRREDREDPDFLCPACGCVLSFPAGARYYSHFLRQMMTASGAVFVCRETGRVHCCDRRCGGSVLARGGAAYVCPYSGLERLINLSAGRRGPGRRETTDVPSSLDSSDDASPEAETDEGDPETKDAPAGPRRPQRPRPPQESTDADLVHRVVDFIEALAPQPKRAAARAAKAAEAARAAVLAYLRRCTDANAPANYCTALALYCQHAPRPRRRLAVPASAAGTQLLREPADGPQLYFARVVVRVWRLLQSSPHFAQNVHLQRVEFKRIAVVLLYIMRNEGLPLVGKRGQTVLVLPRFERLETLLCEMGELAAVDGFSNSWYRTYFRHIRSAYLSFSGQGAYVRGTLAFANVTRDIPSHRPRDTAYLHRRARGTVVEQTGEGGNKQGGPLQ